MMKIVYLNIWHAKMRKELGDFIRNQAKDTDVFCFQEAYDDMQLLCEDILANYRKLSAYKFVTKDDDFPQVTYVRKGVEIVKSGTILMGEKNSGLGLYVQCKTANGNLYICNFHGMSRPVDKRDNPERLKASRELLSFFQGNKGHKLIGGDFNLHPDTQSIQIFAENGYQDLIENFNIKTTRNRLAWDRFPDNKEYYSDYVFVSPGTRIKHFSVPENEVSDHLPLIVEVEL